MDLELQVLTHHGESAYECLVKWRLRTGDDLDESSVQACIAVEQQLANLMRKGDVHRIRSVLFPGSRSMLVFPSIAYH